MSKLTAWELPESLARVAIKIAITSKLTKLYSFHPEKDLKSKGRKKKYIFSQGCHYRKKNQNQSQKNSLKKPSFSTP